MHLFVYADQLFLILYKELYYRHVYARVQVIYVVLVSLSLHTVNVYTLIKLGTEWIFRSLFCIIKLFNFTYS